MFPSSLMGTPPDHGSGSGSALNPIILITAGIAALVATVLATFSIWLQLKNYRRPILQRQVIRIMLMIPLYAISSFISLFSLEAGVVIDALRDIYESFVIYCFFHLLLDYLGGERSLLILLHGRPPKRHVFPVSLFKAEIDVSDPFTFLMLKRGILRACGVFPITLKYYHVEELNSLTEYVQIKPILAIVTLIMKATDTYREGDFRTDAGYLYVSLIYNLSIFIALYSLAMFWRVINDDVHPFRPMPKFLCIKGILFFCFWQSITISLLVSPLQLITHIGPYKDVEHISIAISDVLICYEMPFFAVAHMYAFAHTDYIDPLVHYAARLRFWYAFRDGFGLRDVVEDSKATLHSTANYRTYEPVEGGMHVGVGRDRRIRAGLRYAKGGRQKYWLPMPEDEEVVGATAAGPLAAVKRRWDEHQGYAPLAAEEAADVVHEGFTESDPNARTDAFSPDYTATAEDDLDLRFSSPNEDGNEAVEAVYEESRKLVFGDYNYPVVDVSTEAARIKMWDEEERILGGARSAAYSWRGGRSGTLAYAVRAGTKDYGATDTGNGAGQSSNDIRIQASRKNGKGPELLPHPAVIDYTAETVPDIDINGIRLKWTKSGAAVPTSPSPSSNANLPPNVRRSTSSNSKAKVTVSTPAPRPKLPNTKSSGGDGDEEPQPEHVSDPDNSDKEPVDEREDAVDLVVEDHHAGELEMEWERRRGEPALAGASGLKKVFRRKYHVDGGEDDDGGEGEVEIEEARHAGEQPGELPERVRMKIHDSSRKGKGIGLDFPEDLVSPESGQLSPWAAPVGTGDDLFTPKKDTEIIISRETQPPPHAVLEVRETPSVSPGVRDRDLGRRRGLHILGDSEDEGNPWG